MPLYISHLTQKCIIEVYIYGSTQVVMVNIGYSRALCIHPNSPFSIRETLGPPPDVFFHFAGGSPIQIHYQEVSLKR